MPRSPNLCAVAVLLVLLGCGSIGPQTLPRDRFDYSSALGESWKRQTLLNIVKLRYMDLPMFLDVGQIVSGYSLETAINAGGQLSSSGAIQGDNLALGGSARFTDRPTITYVPMTGDQYLRNMLEPLRPVTLFRLIQAGYNASALLELSAQAFNGLHNRTQGLEQRQADPDFLRAIDLLARVQSIGAIGLGLSSESETGTATVVVIRKTALGEETEAAIAELKTLLGLSAEATEFELIYSPVQGKPTQLALQTRSPLQILMALSSYVEIPESEIDDGRAVPAPPVSVDRRPLVRVRSGESEPEDAYFTVYYRSRWFWIEDTDWRSKAMFSFVMFVFTLGERGEEQQAPVLTIPTQ